MTYVGKQPDDIRLLMEQFESYSYPLVKQVSGWFNVNSDIRWFSNATGEFDDSKITEYYKNDQYSRNTRWDFWNKLIPVLKDNNIRTNLDIGCANNHFSFLCNKNNIFSVGIEPREDCVYTTDRIFKENFGNKFGYIGNIKTFVDYFDSYNEKIFDCITILNFLHGNDHISEEIKKLFEILPKVANYTVVSEPKWNDLSLPVMTDNFVILDKINNTVSDHILYKL